jgi:hypothetical protein
VVVPSAGDRWVVDSYFTLKTSKARFTNQSEMYSAGVETASLYKLLVFGIEDEVWNFIALEVRADD